MEDSNLEVIWSARSGQGASHPCRNPSLPPHSLHEAHPTEGFTDTLASAPPIPPLLLGSHPQDAVCFAWEPGIKKT